MARPSENKYTDEYITTEIKEAMQILGVNYMPSQTELREIKRGSLSNRIANTRRFSGWAQKLNLQTKRKANKKTQSKTVKITPNLKRFIIEDYIRGKNTNAISTAYGIIPKDLETYLDTWKTEGEFEKVLAWYKLNSPERYKRLVG